MFDLIVSGGTAVMPASTEAADIGVSGGKIAAIGAPGSLAAIGAARVVDAAGQIVIPGGVDPHIHAGMPIVGGPTVAAIGNAVAHALGARLRDLPLTRERVMAALLKG